MAALKEEASPRLLVQVRELREAHTCAKRSADATICNCHSWAGAAFCKHASSEAEPPISGTFPTSDVSRKVDMPRRERYLGLLTIPPCRLTVASRKLLGLRQFSVTMKLSSHCLLQPSVTLQEGAAETSEMPSNCPDLNRERSQETLVEQLPILNKHGKLHSTFCNPCALRDI